MSYPSYIEDDKHWTLFPAVSNTASYGQSRILLLRNCIDRVSPTETVITGPQREVSCKEVRELYSTQTAILAFAWRGATFSHSYSRLFLRVIMTGKYPKTTAILLFQLFSLSDCVAAQLNWYEMSDKAYHDVSTVTRLPRLWASDFSCWDSVSSYRSQTGVKKWKPWLLEMLRAGEHARSCAH